MKNRFNELIVAFLFMMSWLLISIILSYMYLYTFIKSIIMNSKKVIIWNILNSILIIYILIKINSYQNLNKESIIEILPDNSRIEFNDKIKSINIDDKKRIVLVDSNGEKRLIDSENSKKIFILYSNMVYSKRKE